MADASAVVQVVLVWNAAKPSTEALPANLVEFAAHLWRAGRAQEPCLIHSVWANFQPARTNTIMGPLWQHLHGPEDLWQTFWGAMVNVPLGSFVQANFGAMDAALAEVARSLPPAAAVADLHAGVGTIGRSQGLS